LLGFRSWIVEQVILDLIKILYHVFDALLMESVWKIGPGIASRDRLTINVLQGYWSHTQIENEVEESNNSDRRHLTYSLIPGYM